MLQNLMFEVVLFTVLSPAVFSTNLSLMLLDSVLFILCLGAVCFYCYAIYGVIIFLRHSDFIDPSFHPPITILKPLCGLDDETYENLASFCHQDYLQYQIIFSIRELTDPAVAVVQQIIKDFPKLDLQLVISDRTIGTNFKVCNLSNAENKAAYAILLLADSDVRVGSDYLRRVVQPMRDLKVGVVTCLYRPVTRGWIAHLEAIGISTDYLAGVLVANQLGGIKFALGPTIVIRKNVLESIGGFSAIADHLADDFQLGYLPAQAGYKIVLSNYVIDHMIDTENLAGLIQRQIRWFLCTRVSRPWGYLGLIFTHGTVMSLLFLIATAGSQLGWIMLLIAWSMRLVMAWAVAVKTLHDLTAKRRLWLVPIRDLMSFILWCYCLLGNRFEWRGRKLKLTKGGKLLAVS